MTKSWRDYSFALGQVREWLVQACEEAYERGQAVAREVTKYDSSYGLTHALPLLAWYLQVAYTEGYHDYDPTTIQPESEVSND